jgi:hypothetical protein
MNRTHLPRILVLESKFPAPKPDFSHVCCDDLYHLKMLLVKQFICQHKKSGSRRPLPNWITEALDDETPQQRTAARIAAGLNPVPPMFHGRPRLTQDRMQPNVVERKRAIECLPNPSQTPSDQLRRISKTIANRRQRIRGKRHPRRASRG